MMEPERDDKAIPYISQDMLAADVDMPAAFESRIRLFPPVTLAIALINVSIFVWMAANGVLETPEALTDAGALVREKVLGGEIHRLLTAIFMHGGFDHILGNLIMLYVLGMTLEHAVGPVLMVVIFTTSGVSGSILSVMGSEGPSVGASGAIFGLSGATWVYFHRLRGAHDALDRRIGVTLGVVAAYQLLNGLLSPYVDNWAHAGGLLGGLLLGRLVRLPSREGIGGPRPKD